MRHVGLSNVGRSHVDTAREIVPIVSVQNRYSLTARDSEEVLKKCEEEGLGFIPWFPLDAGGIGQGRDRGRRAAARRDADAGRAGLAARALAGDAADPGHVLGRAPRGERRGRGA